MRSLPLFKFGDRARSTSFGIALCTMFIVASFSIAGGLETSMNKLADNFSSDRYLITVPGEGGPEFIQTSSLEPFVGRIATGTCLEAFVLQYNQSVTVFCISDRFGVLPEQFYVREKEVLVGPALAMSGYITLVTNNTVNASIDGRFSSSFFPPSWVFAREDLVQDLTGRTADNYNFVVARELNSTEISSLEELRGSAIE